MSSSSSMSSTAPALRHLVPSLFLLAASPLAVAAAEALPAPAVPAAESITVTAPRESLTAPGTAAAQEDAATVPGGTTVISGSEIAKGRASTFRDVLATAPGVMVQSRFGSEESRLSIRGSGIQRTFHLRGVVILQDGQPINQADGGADFQAIEPGAVDHVTVHRGANALEDGAASLGGAIDYVSPTGATVPAARVRVEGGSFGYGRILAQGGGVAGDLDGVVTGSAYRQVGYRAHSYQENYRASGNLGWRIAPSVENRTWLSYSRSDSELPGTLTRQQVESDPEQAGTNAELRDIKRDYPLLRLADRIAWVSGEERVEVGGGWQRKDLYHPLTFARIEQDGDDLTGNLRLASGRDWFGRGNRLVGGVNVAWGSTDARQFNYTTLSGHTDAVLSADAVQLARQAEVFLEERHEVVAKTWAIVGAQAVWAQRIQDDRFLSNGDQSDGKIWRAVNPKVGVLHELRDHGPGDQAQVYANVSRSSEPPTFAEYIQRDTSGATRPQQELDDQSAWTAEIGTRGEALDQTWDLSLYYAEVRDEYLTYQLAPNLTQTINADRTRHAGVEAGHAWSVVKGVFAGDDRIVLGNTWTFGWFRFADDPVYGNNQLPGLPAQSWRGEVRWERGGWYAGPVFEAQSATPVDFQNTTYAAGSLLYGARAGYQSAHGFSAFIEGRNLSDETWIATTTIANPATPTAPQALYYPGDGLGVVAGGEWRH